MTKAQMNAKATELLSAHKANKALTKAMTALFDEYMKTAKGTAEKREKLITVDGNEYQWCNRHEVYEPLVNFAEGKKGNGSCKLAAVAWNNLSRQVREIEGKLSKALDDEDFEAAAAVNKELKSLKDIRAGRYDFDANALQFPDIEDYDYDYNHFIQG